MGLRPLVSTWFQDLLTQLTAVLFTVQSPYSFTIGHRGVFSLARWSALLHAGFHEPRTTLVRLSTPSPPVDYRALTVSGRPFQAVRLGLLQLEAPATPGRTPVWAVPISLAATHGIDVSFCSYRYLDVSVPCVRPPRLYIHRGVTRRWGFPIRTSRDRRLLASSPGRFVGCHVLRRLSMPRHPPCTLSNLITLIGPPRLRAKAIRAPARLAAPREEGHATGRSPVRSLFQPGGGSTPPGSPKRCSAIARLPARTRARTRRAGACPNRSSRVAQ